MPDGLDIDELPTREAAAEAADDELALIRALVERRSKTTELILDEETEERLAQRIIQDVNDAVGDNQEFRLNHVAMLKNWRSTPEPKDFPYPNASNITVPLTSFFIEQSKARYAKALLGDDLYARFSSLDGSIKPEVVDEVTKWFDYELKEVVVLEEVLEEILGSVLLDGFDLPIASYEHEEKRLCSRREFELADGIRLSDQLLQAIQTAFADTTVIAVDVVGKGLFRVRHLLGRDEERTADVSFSIEGTVLVAEIERDEVTFDGVRVKSPTLDDVVINNTGPDINKIPMFVLRTWMMREEFEEACRPPKGIARKFRRLSDEDFEACLASAQDKQGAVVMRELSDLQDREEGTDTSDTNANTPEHRWVEIYRWEGRFKIEERIRDLVVWVQPDRQIILRMSYLEEVNKDGQRSPIKFDFIRAKDRFYSLGLAEWVRHVQAEIDAIHNQRLDGGLIANVPFGFYEPAAGLDKTTLQLEPGKMYPVKDASKVVFPKLGWSPVWSFSEESLVRKYGQEQAGLGDPATGAFASKRTTASEFAGTMGAIDLRTELIVRGLLRSLRKLLYRIFGLYQQFVPDGRVFQESGVEGEKVVRTLKRDRLNGRLTLHLTGDVRKISAQIERDMALNMLSLLLNQILIQMGIVKPDTVYAAVEKVVRAFGYTGVPIHRPDMPEDSQPPAVEHKIMLREEYVAPSPVENFSEHLSAHARLATDPVIETWTDKARQILAQHIVQTQKMQQAVALMKQQQAAMATQMRASMEQMGVRPGQAGGQQTGDQATPGTAEEGVQGPMAPTEQMGGV